MPLAGKQLTYKQALAMCWAVGFRKMALTIAVAVMTAESGRFSEATHVNDDGSVDRGVYQINNRAHPEVMDAEAFDPETSARFALVLSHGGSNWSAWSAFNSKRYLLFIPAVLAVRVLHTWRDRIKFYV